MKMNKKLLQTAASAAIGYATGMLNPAYVIGLRKGYDIRKKGSGNPGASNTIILEGKKAGLFVMAFDISKAAVAVSLSRRLFPKYDCAGETAGTACVLGHMFPATLGFRGGKGLACLGGEILAFSLHDFATMLFFESVLFDGDTLYLPCAHHAVGGVSHLSRSRDRQLEGLRHPRLRCPAGACKAHRESQAHRRGQGIKGRLSLEQGGRA